MAVTKKTKPQKKTASRQAKTQVSKKKAISKQPKGFRGYIARNWIALWVLVAIAVPQIALLWRPLVGVYTIALSLAALLGLALRVESARRLAIAASILPVTLLVSLSLPQPDAFAQAGLFYSTVLLLVIMCNYTFSLHESLDFSALAKQNWLLLPLMVVIGEVLGGLGLGILHHTTYIFHGVPLGLVAVGAVIFAAAEELLFRGLIQEQARKVVHPIVAGVLASAAYVVIYVAHGSILSIAFAAISGVVLSTVYYFKQNLTLTTILNSVMKLTYLGLLATYVLR